MLGQVADRSLAVFKKAENLKAMLACQRPDQPVASAVSSLAMQEGVQAVGIDDLLTTRDDQAIPRRQGFALRVQ